MEADVGDVGDAVAVVAGVVVVAIVGVVEVVNPVDDCLLISQGFGGDGREDNILFTSYNFFSLE